MQGEIEKIKLLNRKSRMPRNARAACKQLFWLGNSGGLVHFGQLAAATFVVPGFLRHSRAIEPFWYRILDLGACWGHLSFCQPKALKRMPPCTSRPSVLQLEHLTQIPTSMPHTCDVLRRLRLRAAESQQSEAQTRGPCLQQT